MRTICLVAALVLSVALVASDTLKGDVEKFQDPTEVVPEVTLIEDTNAGGSPLDTHATPVSDGPASGGVDSIIPEFERSPYWAAANEKEKAAFEQANEHYMKIAPEKFAASNAREHELNEKAEVAIVALRKAKEAIQKEYYRDDPADYGGPAMTTSDKADEKRYKKYPIKLGGTGSWGPSGTPNKRKWYSDGVISTDAWSDKQGHYILGAHRRRVGAGYGRRRAVAAQTATVNGTGIAASEKGHPALQEAFGNPAKIDAENTEAAAVEDPLLKEGLKGSESVETETTDASEVKEKSLAAKGEVEADPSSLNPAEAKTLDDTGAGTDAPTDDEGHFDKSVTESIIGEENTKELMGGSPAPAPEEAATATEDCNAQPACVCSGVDSPYTHKGASCTPDEAHHSKQEWCYIHDGLCASQTASQGGDASKGYGFWSYDPCKPACKPTATTPTAAPTATPPTAAPTAAPAPKDCTAAEVQGQEFYTWEPDRTKEATWQSGTGTGGYCYHIVAGGVLERGQSREESKCNAEDFKLDLVIGRGQGVNNYYPNGDTRGCPRAHPHFLPLKKRETWLYFKSDPAVTTSSAVATEPSTCTYRIVVTLGQCHK